jgi:uncharacterized protein YndB with AHSA1/START domain
VSITIRARTVIAAPPERVWAAIERIDSHTRWMQDAVAITFTTEQHAGVGTAFDCLTRVGPFRLTDRFVVTRWDPGRAMGIEHRGAVTGVGEFRLQAAGAGPVAGGRDNDNTEFTWEETLHFPWWLGAAVGERAGRPILRRIWNGNLRRLKTQIETAELPSPS